MQLSKHTWLVLDEVPAPRFLIVEGPLIWRATGETYVKHRIEWWTLDPKTRHTLAVCDGLLAAETWCKAEIDRVTEQNAKLSASLDRRGF